MNKQNIITLKSQVKKMSVDESIQLVKDTFGPERFHQYLSNSEYQDRDSLILEIESEIKDIANGLSLDDTDTADIESLVVALNDLDTLDGDYFNAMDILDVEPMSNDDVLNMIDNLANIKE